jgi:hypothetical protein
MTLTEEFKSALEQSNITKLEMSWTLGVTMDRMNELLSGAPYHPHEELTMLRFVFKERMKKTTAVIDVKNELSKMARQDHPPVNDTAQ